MPNGEHSTLYDAITAAGAAIAGAMGLKGWQWGRRRNGHEDADRIVTAIRNLEATTRNEGRETRRVMHESHAELKDVLASIKADTRILLDRGGK